MPAADQFPRAVAERSGKVLTYAVWHLFRVPTAVVLANPFWAPTLQLVADGAVVGNSATVGETVALDPTMLSTQRGSTSSCCQILLINICIFLISYCFTFACDVRAIPAGTSVQSKTLCMWKPISGVARLTVVLQSCVNGKRKLISRRRVPCKLNFWCLTTENWILEIFIKKCFPSTAHIILVVKEVLIDIT